MSTKLELYNQITGLLNYVEENANQSPVQAKLDYAEELLWKAGLEFPEEKAFSSLDHRLCRLHYESDLRNLPTLDSQMKRLKLNLDLDKTYVFHRIHTDIHESFKRITVGRSESSLPYAKHLLDSLKKCQDGFTSGELSRAREAYNHFQMHSEEMIQKFPDLADQVREISSKMSRLFGYTSDLLIKCTDKKLRSKVAKNCYILHMHEGVQSLFQTIPESRTDSPHYYLDKLDEQHERCKTAFADKDKNRATYELLKFSNLVKKAIDAFPQIRDELHQAQTKLCIIYENSEFNQVEVSEEKPRVVSCSDLFWKGVAIIRKPFEVIDDTLSKKDL